ncbi:MAG: hypothetical protein R3230_01525 [Nitrosopumilaceae archaeon]|nr:hypothetical protein [Nitrosopumilaceae archaeon]
MATNNAINNTSNPIADTAMTIDPGVSPGDSYVQFDINSVGKFRFGVDDSDDSLRCSIGSALGTSDALTISSGGAVNRPLTSAFLAYLASTDSNQTGDGTSYTIGTTVAFTEIDDQNGDFNTNGTFTAPVTGTYYLMGALELAGLTSSFVDCEFTLTTSNATYASSDQNPGFTMDGSNNLGVLINVNADMDSSDTATISIVVDGDTKTIDITGGASPVSMFCGYLLG